MSKPERILYDKDKDTEKYLNKILEYNNGVYYIQLTKRK